MSLLRFATAQALFETFPELSQKISARPSEQFPTKFLQALLAAARSRTPSRSAPICCRGAIRRRQAPHGQAARTEARNRPTSRLSRVLSPDSDFAAVSTWADADPV
jgi:hypothetical protein